MSESLRPFLLALVLLNLALVQATGSVPGGWMATLWLCALASPVLQRMRDVLAYRLVWNGAVLIAFTFLVHHAMTTGLLHMLEDGMLLAALCQVHLLNNVGTRQRPDLLFFNSFLVTFVTSFFSHDLAWSVCFFAYAAVLIPALQVHVVLPHGRAAEPALLRAVLRDSAPRAAIGLLLTAIVFVCWPRNFRHEGWLSDTLALADPQLVAFAEEIRLDRSTTPTLSEAPVMRIKPRLKGTLVPERWRGVSFVEFDGSSWEAYRTFDLGTRKATDVPWIAESQSEWQRPDDGSGCMEFDVRLLEPSACRLFLPLDATRMTLRQAGAPLLVDPKSDGVLAFEPAGARRGEVRYTAGVGTVSPQHRRTVGPSALAILRQLPPSLPHSLTTLAETIRSELPGTPTEEQVAAHFTEWLSTHRRYALPGTNGAARNLGEFLLGTGGGHCEYFATTLALLLRTRGLPCRVVGGYLAHEYDETTDETVVRQKDAHAWVEVLLPTVGWTTFDATPAAELRRDQAAASWAQALWQKVESAWQLVTGFDEKKRAQLWAWLRALPATLADAARSRPSLLVYAAVLLAGWLLLRRSRRREDPAVLALRRAVRGVRLATRAGETPRELLVRARAGGCEGAACERLAAAVATHERTRYRRSAAAPARRGPA